MKPLSLEGLEPGEVGRLGRREAPGGHDREPRADAIAAVGSHLPAPAALVESHRGDASVQLDVTAQVEAVGDVTEVAQQFVLAGIALRPDPVTQEIRIEGVLVVDALDIAARSRIAVPEPGAADPVTRLEDARREPQSAEAVQHVQAGEAGADDHGVEGLVAVLPLLRDNVSHRLSSTARRRVSPA